MTASWQFLALLCAVAVTGTLCIFFYRRYQQLVTSGEHPNTVGPAQGKQGKLEAILEAERINEALKATKIGVWEWDIENDTWFASPSYFSMLGYQPVVGQADRAAELQKIHPDDRENVATTIRRILNGQNTTNQYVYQARIRHANGDYRWISVRCTVTQYNGQQRPSRMLGVRIDIDDLKKAHSQIEWLAHHDILTKLPNREALTQYFTRANDQKSAQDTTLALLFIDLDRFKNINDTLGHSIGDQLLIAVAERMCTMLGDQGFVARQGGDEFVVILPNVDNAEAWKKANQLREVLSRRYELDIHQFIVTPSIGISMYPSDGRDFDTLYKRADTAMYSAKNAGRNRCAFFTQEMQVKSSRILQLENALHDAVANNELTLVFQPQVCLTSGNIVGAEALVRWNSPTLGVVSPAEFIPIAEDSGQILHIGEWVIKDAIRQMKDWQSKGLAPLRIAVNLSYQQFQAQDLPELITSALQQHGIEPQYLELELTERIAMMNPENVVATLNQFQQLGVKTSIDDFGTGYSSLSYLRRFPVYKLKIDQSFVRNLTNDHNSHAIVHTIIVLAQQLGMSSIAEGVETAEQLAQLRDLGCEEVQGYYISKPIAAAEFAATFLQPSSQSVLSDS